MSKPDPLPWFRFYCGALNDPKVQRLPGDMFKAWVNMLCLAGINDGSIPKSDVAFALRLTEKAAAGVIDYLIERDLLDDRGDIVTPHNWDGRQFRSDVTDPTAADRMRRYRKNRNGKRNADRNNTVTVTDTRAEQSRYRPETEQIDDAVAGAAGVEAVALVSEIARKCGIPECEHWPVGWHGAPMRVAGWLREWPRDAILASVTRQMARRRSPPNTIQFFEKGIAEFIAQNAAPLPVAQIIPMQEVVHVHRQQPQDVVGDAANRIRAHFRSDDDAAADEGARPDEGRGDVEIIPPSAKKS